MIHERGGKQQFAERPLDEVEWELVRADIAHLKAEQEKSGDWKKWEKDQRFMWRDRFASHERNDLGRPEGFFRLLGNEVLRYGVQRINSTAEPLQLSSGRTDDLGRPHRRR